MAKVTMPQLGESVAEGTIGKWLKKPGDHVAKYEPLLEVITDKVNAEVPSPFEGILREILVEEGATVPNNAEIAVIDETGGRGELPPARLPRRGRRRPSAGPVRRRMPAAGRGRARRRHPGRPTATQAARPPLADGPAARRRASSPARRSRRPDDPGRAAPPPRARPRRRPDRRDRRRWPDHPRGRDGLRRVAAHRPAGRPPGRVRASAAPAAAAPAARRAAPTAVRPASPALAAIDFPAGADEVLVPMTQMRKGIAAQMTRALQVPHAYVQMEVDADEPRPLPRGAKKATSRRARASRLSFVPVRRQGLGRGAQAQPDVQRPLDGPGPARQAPDQHRASPSRWTTA